MCRVSVLLLCFVASAHADELRVLPVEKERPPKQMLARYLSKLAAAAVAERTAAYEALRTPEEIRAYQQRLRKFFLERIGGLPERTPLNARVVGRLDGDGCRIEKVIFESQPKFYVTATLYLPKSKPPYPAVLVPCGHTIPGKASNQRLCTFFAQSGIAALTYDPIGQGERFQFPDAKGKPRYKPTTEHTLVGVSCILVGRNTATYRIWDGMRCLDYLRSRDDIVADRLGCTGVSGGGTLTEYLMALDPRIRAAAPACAPTTFARRFATIGPGDAEQNIFGQVAFGLDHADYSIMRAPKPTLLLTATRDFVDIRGSWDLFREVKRLYTRMGYAERVDLVEADAKHGFSKPLREGSVRWMRRWLLGKDDAVTEADIRTHPFAELLCTKKGQVQHLEGARSVMDLNAEISVSRELYRRRLWKADNRKTALETVREVAGIRKIEDLPAARVRKFERLEREGYHIQKLALDFDGITLPSLLFLPDKPKGRRVLYVHGFGKDKDADTRIADLAKSGCVVLAIDVRGVGETGATKPSMWEASFDDFFVAYLLGKSFVGMRAEDVLAAGRFLSSYESETPTAVEVVAVGVAGPLALHAVALERSLFSKLTLRESLVSWKPVVRDPSRVGKLVNVVHGALRFYDLDDLIRSLPDGRVEIIEPLR